MPKKPEISTGILTNIHKFFQKKELASPTFIFGIFYFWNSLVCWIFFSYTDALAGWLADSKIRPFAITLLHGFTYAIADNQLEVLKRPNIVQTILSGKSKKNYKKKLVIKLITFNRNRALIRQPWSTEQHCPPWDGEEHLAGSPSRTLSQTNVDTSQSRSRTPQTSNWNIRAHLWCR